jgi:hypothetical protein
MGHITIQIAPAEFARLGKVSDLFDRAPTRIERLKNDSVSRINRKGGRQIARDKPVYTLFGVQMMKLCHFALPRAVWSICGRPLLFGANDCRQCRGLEENAGSYLIIEFSRPVTFDGHLDSHRRKKDRKNEHRDQPDLESGQ